MKKDYTFVSAIKNDPRRLCWEIEAKGNGTEN